MGNAPTVGQYHFEGWDLPTKHGWMHSGPGVAAATLMQDVVNRMADRMITSGELVGRLLSGAEWAGEAATAAGRAMQRGASQINQTAAEAATAQRCVTELGESFQTAQHGVPSPNEIPTGLGDKFLHGAAEGFNALSPFDVQSPLHDAMEQRRALDQQANLALTQHMIASRDRVDAIPAVAAPAPMAVAGQFGGASGGDVGQPGGVVPTAAGFGAAPAATTPAATTPAASTVPWGAGVPTTSSAGPGAGTGGTPLPPSASPASTGLMGLTGGVNDRLRPGVFQSTESGAGPGGAAFGPSSSGHTGAGRAPVHGRAGLGARPGAGRDSILSRSAPGQDGLVGGLATRVPRGIGISGAGASGAGISGTGISGSRAGGDSFLHPPVGNRGDDDTEHKDRFAQQTDHIVGELPLVAPAVIGETPDEQRRRLARSQDVR
jgi:hypothetical protein